MAKEKGISKIKKVLEEHNHELQYVDRLVKDGYLRTIVIALLGMALNLIYALFNGVIGVTRHSAWYGSLSAYYIFLCVMRFLAVFYAKDVYITKKSTTKKSAAKKPITKKTITKKSTIKKSTTTKTNLKEKEWKTYRNCGFLLSLVSIALAGAVIMLVSGEGGKSYPGLMIYAVATYTFVKMGIAIKNMIQARKQKSYLMMTLRNISYSDALVSMLSLQTALLASFGKPEDEFTFIMNALTGIAVCMMILALGIYMQCDAKKKR